MNCGTRFAGIAGLTLALAGCGSVGPSLPSLWPFGEGKGEERPRAPAGATAYQCEGGKQFYVRYLDGGASAWVILREREFRLDKTSAASGVRYTNGSAVLETDEKATTLSDGPALAFTGCKAAGG